MFRYLGRQCLASGIGRSGDSGSPTNAFALFAKVQQQSHQTKKQQGIRAVGQLVGETA